MYLGDVFLLEPAGACALFISGGAPSLTVTPPSSLDYKTCMVDVAVALNTSMNYYYLSIFTTLLLSEHFYYLTISEYLYYRTILAS